MDKQKSDKQPNWWQKRKLWQKILIVIVVLFVLLVIFTPSSKNGSNSGGNNSGNNVVTGHNEIKSNAKKVKVVDLSAMDDKAIADWCGKVKLNCTQVSEYSDTAEKGKFISQSSAANTEVVEGSTLKYTRSAGKKPTVDQQNALEKAESYSRMSHMSKKRLYDQLTSEYGEKFEAADAQYAIDHLNVDYKQNALKKAKSYRETSHMSKKRLYDQLVSEYGEQFTPEEAKYAVDHLN